MNEKISNVQQICYARQMALSEENKELISIKVGKLQLSLNVTNALDIYDLSYMGENLAFLSGAGLNKTNDMEFSSRFEGGFLYTCGLDMIGGQESMVTHGTLHLHKARILRKEIKEIGNEFKVFIEGEIGVYKLFQENLVVRRCYEISENEIKLCDTVTNFGAENSSVIMLYHFNIGYPMLSEKTSISFNAEKVIGRTESAQKRIANINEFALPTRNNEEAVFIATAKNEGIKAEVENKEIGRKISFETISPSLKFLTIWKSEKSHDYALGIEPATSHLDDKKFISLAPKMSITNDIKITIK